MGGISLAQGRLFGALYEAILYGINLILVLALLCLFAQRKTSSTAQRVRTGLICVLFLLCTIHMVAMIQSINVAFFRWESADTFFNDRAQPIVLLQIVVFSIAIIIGDAMMVHRLYVVFCHNWHAIIIPCVSLLLTAGTWCALLNDFRVSAPGATLYSPTIVQLAPAAFILSFVTNAVITVMIIVRVMLALRSARNVLTETASFHRRFLAYTIESGLLYPVSVLVTCILFFARNYGLEILASANMQLLCIVPTLLSLQMRLNLSLYDAAMGARHPAHIVTEHREQSVLQFRRLSLETSPPRVSDMESEPPTPSTSVTFSRLMREKQAFLPGELSELGELPRIPRPALLDIPVSGRRPKTS